MKSKELKLEQFFVLVSGSSIIPAIVSAIIPTVIFSAASSWAWWSPISPLSVRTIPRKVAALSALVASHARIKSSAPAASCTRSGNCHTDATVANLLAIDLALGLLSILAVTEHDKGETGDGPGHPDLLERSVFAKHLFQITFVGIAIQIGNV